MIDLTLAHAAFEQGVMAGRRGERGPSTDRHFLDWLTRYQVNDTDKAKALYCRGYQAETGKAPPEMDT